METTLDERSFVRLGPHSHDSLQYHVMCEDGRIFTARVFQTDTALKEWAWVYEDGAITVLHDLEAPATRMTGDGPFFVDGTGLSVETDADGTTRIDVHPDSADGTTRIDVHPDSADGFVIELEPAPELDGRYADAAWEPQRFSWQPDLAATVHYRGEALAARCFAKRYTWEGNSPAYWMYRMLSGHVADGGPAVWTAEAMFQDVCHGNFKVQSRDGALWSGLMERTHHGDMQVDTVAADGATAAVTMRPLGQVDLYIQGGGGTTNTRLTQWPTTYTYTDPDGRRHEALGIYEYACGALA